MPAIPVLSVVEGLESLRRYLRPACWRKALFAGMCSNARVAADFFGLPPSQVVVKGRG